MEKIYGTTRKNIFIDKNLKSKEEVLNFIADSAYILGITTNKEAL